MDFPSHSSRLKKHNTQVVFVRSRRAVGVSWDVERFSELCNGAGSLYIAGPSPRPACKTWLQTSEPRPLSCLRRASVRRLCAGVLSSQHRRLQRPLWRVFARGRVGGPPGYEQQAPLHGVPRPQWRGT